MDWWQTQLNFAVWVASAGCGVSAGDHMQAEDPMIRAVFRFHFYYTIKRVLSEMGTPLPGDTASDPTKNPYDKRAYKRICDEFGVSPHTNWHIPRANSGLGRMYIYQHGRPAWGIDDWVVTPNKYTFSKAEKGKTHIWAVHQDSTFHRGWHHFILDKSQGLTQAGVERVNDSIWTYVWCVLNSQSQTRAEILGTGTAFSAQKQFLADVEDSINSPVDEATSITRYQDALQYTRTPVNFVFGAGLYMSPSDMLLHVGKIAGYNNLILTAGEGVTQGLNTEINAYPEAPPDAVDKDLALPAALPPSPATPPPPPATPPLPPGPEEPDAGLPSDPESLPQDGLQS